MNYGINEDYEGDIDLKDLFYYVLYKWRIILLVAVIFAASFGTYKLVSIVKARNALRESIKNGTALEEDYPEDYITIENTIEEKKAEARESKGKIVDAEIEIMKAEAYVKSARTRKDNVINSITNLDNEKNDIQKMVGDIDRVEEACKVFEIDSNAVPIARKTYKVELDGYSGETLYRDPVDSIIAGIAVDFISNIDAQKFEKEYNVPARYVENYYAIIPDFDANTVTIEAYGHNSYMANGVLEIVREGLNQRKSDVEETSLPFEMLTLNTYNGCGISTRISEIKEQLFNQRIKYNTRIRQIEDDITNLNATLVDIDSNSKKNDVLIENYQEDVESLGKNIENINATIVTLEKDKERTISGTKTFVKDTIKFVFIGFIAGLFLAAIVYAVKYLAGNKLHNTDDITKAFGIPLLSVYNEKKPTSTSRIDLWLYEQKNKGKSETNHEITMALCAKLEYLLEDRADLTICSSCKLDRANILISALQNNMPSRTFKYVYLPLSSDSTNILGNAEMVIMYEERDESYIDGITEEVRQFILMRKTVIGCVIG